MIDLTEAAPCGSLAFAFGESEVRGSYVLAVDVVCDCVAEAVSATIDPNENE